MWPVLEVLSRLVVGGLLVTAGAAKLSSTPAWRQVWILSYQLLPPRVWVIRSVAWLVPVAEVGVGVMLLIGAFGAAGPMAAAALLAIVTAAVVSGLVRGLEISCGCFGRLGDLISWHIVARNVVLLAALSVVAWHGVSTAAVASSPVASQLAIFAVGVALAALLALRSRRARKSEPVDRPAAKQPKTEMSPQ